MAASSNFPKRSFKVSTNSWGFKVTVRGVKLQISANTIVTSLNFSMYKSLNNEHGLYIVNFSMYKSLNNEHDRSSLNFSIYKSLNNAHDRYIVKLLDI